MIDLGPLFPRMRTFVVAAYAFVFRSSAVHG